MRVKNGVRRLFRDNWRLYVLIFPAIAWLGLFAYKILSRCGICVVLKRIRGKMVNGPLFLYIQDCFQPLRF